MGVRRNEGSIRKRSRGRVGEKVKDGKEGKLL